MSWTCPACDRKYPDSALSIQDGYCKICAVDPRELRYDMLVYGTAYFEVDGDGYKRIDPTEATEEQG